MNARLILCEIRLEPDVVFVRQRARELARLLGFDRQDQTRIATAVSEIARNAFEYARGGQVEFQIIEGARRQFVIQIRDQGPGIVNLSDILDRRYRSATGLGLGIIGTKRLMDDLRIDTSTGRGTRVTLIKDLPATAPLLDAARIREIVDQLSIVVPSTPTLELQEQNHELIQALDALREKQDELIQLNRELENTNRGVVALYGELDEKAEALKRASAMKTRFLSNITHEFRTPLGATVNLTEMLLEGLEGPINDSQVKVIQLIKKSSEGLLDLVNDLLDLAKVEAGRIPVRPVEFELKDVFAGLRGLLRPQAEKNPTVRLEFVNPPSLSLFSDEGKISQILRNLVSNALKYTESGLVSVSAAVAESLVEIHVKDSGVGIAGEDLERIFEEFTQIESPLQRKHKGTGIGLSLTRRLTELLGGEIRVQSTLGQGSTFTVRLPRRYTGTNEGAYLSGSAESGDRPGLARPANGPRVLIIDDEESERYFLRSALISRFRCDVHEAGDGAQGLSLAESLKPDLIFLDLNMPEMHGLTVFRELRAKSTLQDIPVIIHSGQRLTPEDHMQLRGVGRILSKGDSEESLIAAISQALAELPPRTVPDSLADGARRAK